MSDDMKMIERKIARGTATETDRLRFVVARLSQELTAVSMVLSGCAPRRWHGEFSRSLRAWDMAPLARALAKDILAVLDSSARLVVQAEKARHRDVRDRQPAAKARQP